MMTQKPDCIEYPYEDQEKTNIRDYAVTSDDDPKPDCIQYPDEDQEKTNISGLCFNKR